MINTKTALFFTIGGLLSSSCSISAQNNLEDLVLPKYQYPKKTEQPSGVYFVGASFETCPINWSCPGPMTSQYLGAFLTAQKYIFEFDGMPGDFHSDMDENIQWRIHIRSVTNSDHEMIKYGVMGLGNDSLRYAPSKNIDEILDNSKKTAEKLLELADTVIAIDLPPIGNNTVPFITEYLRIDKDWWDNELRPAYRENLLSAGVIVIDAYKDWSPNLRERPNMEYPDFHPTTESAKTAAKKIFWEIWKNSRH